MFYKLKQQKGDTIVEVLLAMSVVGLVLGSSFGIANRSINLGRSAQERTVALKIAESQLEQLKALYRNGSTIPADNDFCILSESFELIDSTTNPCTNKNSSGGDGLYTMVISSPPSTGGSYKIYVTWDDISGRSSNEKNKVALYYRLGSL